MKPYFSDGAVTLYAGDCREVLADLPPASIDAVVTDPPYELGFMGRAWDASGIAYDVDMWRQCWQALKPGGHLFAFGGTRTYHRLTCAIEDAGFEIRDSLHWIYGSGFPKSLDVSKAIDKRGGGSHLAVTIGAAIKAARERRGWTTTQADRYFCGGSTNWTWFEGRPRGCHPPTPETFARIVAEWPELAEVAALVAEADREVIGPNPLASKQTANRGTIAFSGASGVGDTTAPATDDARRWQGWGTALKPAHEPIVCARKPLSGTVAANVLEHGTGALNINGCRVEGAPPPSVPQPAFNSPTGRIYGMKTGEGRNGAMSQSTSGRWPTNVVLTHSASCDIRDEGNGEIRIEGPCAPDCPVAEMGRQGGKTGAHGSSRGPGAKTGYANGWASRSQSSHDDSGGASRFFPVFRYEAKAPASERPRGDDGTAHATVKPLALMSWLVRLVTPPGGVVLDPFLGSGTTAEACVIEGFRCVGIERDATHLPLIKARLSKPIQPALGFEDAS